LVKKALTFVGHDEGVSQTYCVRLPGEEQAQQLKEALDQEIESVATATAKDGE
jgi:nucleoporin NUP2